jgi:hypothetical protein
VIQRINANPHNQARTLLVRTFGRRREWAAEIAITLCVICLALVGCGPKGLPSKAIGGAVTCGGQPVPTGQVSFVPIEGTPGPTSAALIVDGRYRVEARGGVPLGKHRVCVDARKKTGRKVEGHNGREAVLVDEEVRMGPEVYASGQSPLVLDLRADSDGTYDIVIPGQ